jgi:hypothetical protein
MTSFSDSQTFDAQLRQALASVRVPTATRERVCSVNYRPRRHSVRARVVVGLVAASVVAAGGFLASQTNGAPTTVQGVYASWTSTPTTPAPDQVAMADATCARALNGQTRPAGGENPYASANGKWQPVVTDPRGPFTLVAENAATPEGTFQGLCLIDATNPSFGGSLISTPSNDVPAPGTIGRPQGGGGSGAEGRNAYSYVEGNVGDGVTGVTLQLANGLTVTSTVANHIYLAWWPGQTVVKSVNWTTDSGKSSSFSVG